MIACPVCGTELPDGSRFCLSCGAQITDPPAPKEERKLATVLFADLVGSTELGEQDPERTRALLDRFYDAMAGEIERAGGTVEKFVGDAVMAAFGAPDAQEDHAERALHVALAMRRRLAELFADRLALRIGVNTGEVVVGRPREGSSFVTGDAVNVCSRLEQAAQPGEILVGERTVAAAAGAFEFSERRTIDAKGKQEPVACRTLLRALSLMRPRGVRGLGTAFVGRERELDVLEATYQRVAEQRRPHLVTIMGEAGVGKTTIARHLWQSLAATTPDPVRRTGRCLPYGRGITYWPLGEVLKEHLGILETDGRDETLSRLRGREILGLTLGLDVAADLHPLAARDRLHDAWLEFLTSLAADVPAVILIEDLHWAEDDLLDLLERVLREVDAPVLLLGTARPDLLDRRPTWGGGRRNSALLWLEPLSSDDTTRMLDELLAAHVPPRIREMIVERAEGNPFFVEELLATLIDRGVVARTNGGWSARELPAGFEIPDSVQAVLAARIDLLAPTDKAALQAAAVIGRIFWSDAVCALLDGGEPDFELLEERDFIRRRAGSSLSGMREYAIKHALTREVAYATLPKARRARLHAAFARWLEGLGDGRDDEHAPLLAHHYAEAVRAEDADLAWGGDEAELERLRARALAWLERAAALALGRYELDDAITLFERAVELVPDEASKAELWRAIGKANALKFDGEAFWTAMQNSLSVCTVRDVCADTYGELAFQTAMRSSMWKRRPDRELVRQWTDQAVNLARAGTPAHVKGLIARALVEADGGETARDASDLADRIGDVELRSWAMAARAQTALDEGHAREGMEWAERRIELLDEVSDPDHRADIYSTAALAMITRGKIDEARRFAAAQDEIARELTAHHRLHGVAMRIRVEEAAGDWERIRELTSRATADVAANVATPCALNARSLLVCALASACAGNPREAERLERAAEDLGMEGYDEYLNPTRIELALALRDLDRVAALLDVLVADRPVPGMVAAWRARLEALPAIGDGERVEEEAPPLIRPGTYLEPFALRALGRVREQPELIEQALARFEEMGLGWHAEQTRELLAAMRA